MPPRRSVTLTDVARHAGVSIATVSRVMNRNGQVDEGTRSRVLESAGSLGYDAPAAARRMEQESERKVEYRVEFLLCPMREQKDILTLDFMSDILRGIQSFFSRHTNVVMNISTWSNDEVFGPEDNEVIMKRLLLADGILVSGNSTDRVVAEMRRNDLNFVLIANDRLDFGVNSVNSDDFAGGVCAARYLIDAGFERIGFLCGSPDAQSYQMRRNGVLAAVVDALGFDRLECRTAASSDDSDIERCFGEWLDSGSCPPAVILTQASAALTAYRVLRERGLSCPEDISLVTFDTIGGNEFGIHFTQFRTFPRELGVKAAQRIYQTMTSQYQREKPYKILIPLEFVEGETVALRSGD